MNKTIMFTHNDLDGVGCGILHKAAFGCEAETYYCGYHNVDEVIQKTLQNVEERYSADFPSIIISDLGIKPETAAIVEKYKGDKILLDHHRTNLWIQEQYAWATIDIDTSGTLLVFNYLDVPKYRDFALHVDDYDRWVHALPKSKQLNRLLFILGTNRFEERMLRNPKVEFEEAEKLLLDLEDEKIEHYADKVEKGIVVYTLADEKKVGVGFADRYHSETAHELINRLDLDAIALIDVNYKKISLRSKPNFDVSVIAKKLGGGGHKNAAGVDFNYGRIEDFHGSKYPLLDVHQDLEGIKDAFFWQFAKVYESIETEEIERLFKGAK